MPKHKGERSPSNFKVADRGMNLQGPYAEIEALADAIHAVSSSFAGK